MDYEKQFQNTFGNFGLLNKLYKHKKINISLRFGSWNISDFKIAMNQSDIQIKIIHNIINLYKTYYFFNGIVFDYGYLSENILEHDNIKFQIFFTKIN